jgi:ferrous iron transport protein B
MIRAAVIEPKVTRLGMTTRLDRVLTHPVYGTLFLVGILGGVFWLTYAVGSPIQGWLSTLVTSLAQAIRSGWIQAPRWLVEFVASGLLGGIGMVLTFVPILVLFFAILGLMEDTGYMARAAYLTDRWMHMMGLHGKSFLPILLGFGCNVPAVLGTRIIESKKARLLTTLLVPLVPCTARMAVITILSATFFGPNAFWVAWSLVGGNLLLLAGLGISLHHFFFEDEHVPFIMELPLYHFPNGRTIGLYIRENIVSFLQKAGTTILVASLIVWALSYFPTGEVKSSYLGMFGQLLEPMGRWMGLPWPVIIAMLTSFVAKENTIATLGVLYGNLNNLASVITPPAALAFLVFQMLFIPCVGTVAAIFQETRSVKWTSASVGIMLVLSLGLALSVYQVGRLF